jgi:ferredoxin
MGLSNIKKNTEIFEIETLLVTGTTLKLSKFFNDAEIEPFYHSLVIDDEKCIRCTHCVKACPTKAIRIVNGKVVLREERCVDCGEL